MASTQEQARDAAQQAKDTAQQATEQARGRVRDEVDRRSTEAGQQASTMADAIRQASHKLRDEGNHQAAKPLDQAAERVEGAGRWLQESDGDAILRDVEDFGRRNPLAVAAAGAAIGFALSRLLKASSRDRYSRGYEPRSTNGGLPATTPTAPPPTPAPVPTAGTAATAPNGPATTPRPGDGTGAVTPGGAVRGGPPPTGPAATTPRPGGIAVPDIPAPPPERGS